MSIALSKIYIQYHGNIYTLTQGNIHISLDVWDWYSQLLKEFHIDVGT